MTLHAPPINVARLRQNLNDATDHLNTVIAEAEGALRACDFGVRASVPIETGPDGSLHLVFGKHSQTWGLLADINGEAVPLRNSSREVRLKAVLFLPTLHEALVSALAVELERVENTIRVAEQFVEGMKKS